LAKKLRVISGWMLNLFFSREIEQMITLRDVEELTSRMARIRARAEKEISANTGSSAGRTEGGYTGTEAASLAYGKLTANYCHRILD
jgi:hypothetical protein